MSEWLGQLKDGQAVAAQKLWERYSSELIAVARTRLANVSRASADEEDVAQSVFSSICRAAALGRFQHVQSRDDLWWLLMAVTRHKVVDHTRRELAQRRGGGLVRNEADLPAYSACWPIHSLDQLMDQSASPEFIVALREEFSRLLSDLKDDRFRMIAIARIEGYSIEEIATKLGVATRTVERKLKIILSKWAQELIDR